MLGGLARRVGVLDTYRQQGPLLVIGGPGEFTLPDGAPLHRDDAGTLSAIYSRMAVTAGWLEPAARNWFHAQGAEPPQGFHPVDQTPVVQQSVVQGKTVGFVLFPAGFAGNPEREKELLSLALRLRGQCDLVIGISPWGTKAERTFLPAASGYYDVILGGGEGQGMRGNMDTRGTVLWARGYGKGMALAVLELMEWPSRQDRPGWAWIEDDNVRFPVVLLDEGIRPDPQTTELLAGQQ